MQGSDGYDLMVRRKRLGLDQREIARLVGSNRPADISELENGHQSPRTQNLREQVERVLDQLESERSKAGAA